MMEECGLTFLMEGRIRKDPIVEMNDVGLVCQTPDLGIGISSPKDVVRVVEIRLGPMGGSDRQRIRAIGSGSKSSTDTSEILTSTQDECLDVTTKPLRSFNKTAVLAALIPRMS